MTQELNEHTQNETQVIKDSLKIIVFVYRGKKNPTILHPQMAELLAELPLLHQIYPEEFQDELSWTMWESLFWIKS